MTGPAMADLAVDLPIDYTPGDSQLRRLWHLHGVVVLHGFLPDGAIDAYCRAFEAGEGATGFGIGTAYRHVPELADLCCLNSLGQVLEEIIGEPAGVHLNLTGWVSTERNWHQDTYLNPPSVGDHYAAVWMALDDVHPDSGPFQYVEGSHRWPVITRDAIFAHIDPSEQADPNWPKTTERFVVPAWEAELERRRAEVTTHLPRRGDVLIWHSRLVHRGSPPRVPGMERRALIAHYSGLSHRPDMPAAQQHRHGGWYFPL